MNSSSNQVKIHTDPQTRYLYATDASMYEELPKGVAFPANSLEIRALVRKAQLEGFSLIPRSAGTSLAGQATGNGVVIDVSRHMTNILELNAKERYAHLQPGVIRDTLNREASKFDLLFGPDTATTNRCMIGGMIGNNSCGSFSIKYGTTRDHILEIETVLSDGSVAQFKPLATEELEQKKQLDSLEGHIYRGMYRIVEQNREQILASYPHPEIIRRNTGYALDRLCRMQPFDPNGNQFNLAEFLCGSEGTLAITSSAKVRLVPSDPARVLIVPHFRSLNSAMEAAVEAVKLDPAAVELVDDIILNATKDNIEQRKNRFFIEGDPKCILIIQFDGQDISGITSKAQRIKEILEERNLCYSSPIISKSAQIERVWNLRKAGLGLLMGLGSEERSPSFCEDTAVRVKDLPSYVKEFQDLLKKYNTHCVFYAHASVGELHLRPVIDTGTEEGILKMKAMAEEVAGLVRKYNGSLSGEHGDGRARAPYIEKVLGPEMMPLLRKVKELWDPNYIFNPGKIINPGEIDNNLRFSPQYRRTNVPTVYQWRKEGDFGQALELCNGAGVCRKLAESGGTMCPSYMATKEEKDSTRGRANLLRQLFSSTQQEAFQSEEIRDALDLCLSCKACKSECPANVDMARMKTEFMQGWHDRKGIKISETFFGKAGKFYPLASRLAPLTNFFNKSKPGKELLHHFLNVHPKRELPLFAKRSFTQWYRQQNGPNRSINMSASVQNKVVLLVDLFTNYHEPEIAKSAVQVLERSGYRVIVPGCIDTGRTRLSKGFAIEAKELATDNIIKLYPFAEQGIPIVGLEPSEILTLRDEYLDLCDDELLEKARLVANNSYQFEEFVLNIEYPDSLNSTDTKRNIYLHGHCHTKALTGNTPTIEALESAGYEVTELETGCCGMAGSFGYEADHYDVSMSIGELVLFPALRKLREGSVICAPGFSCRHQIKDGTGRKAFHPAQLLDLKFGNPVKESSASIE